LRDGISPPRQALRGATADVAIGPDGIDTGLLEDIGERLFGRGSIKT
jgi:hypothetical protein